MSNLDIYDEIFCEIFNLDKSKLKDLTYQSIPEWDSIGHMELMTALENKFEIQLDIDDIIDFSSYEIGKNILQKYRIEF